MNFIKNKTLYIIAGLLLIFILVAADQFTKYLAVSRLMEKDSFWLIKDVLCFQYLENTGAAFSMLEGKMLFFYILTPVIVLAMFWGFIKMFNAEKFGPLQLILIFVIAGAIGNYIDRVRLSYVVDFIYFVPINFPIFNVADIYVTVSVFVLVFLIIFYYKDEDFERIGFGKKKSGNEKSDDKEV